MNKVIKKDWAGYKLFDFSTEEDRENHIKFGYTAFIGHLEHSGQEDDLFLITYSCVVNAKDPMCTYSGNGTKFDVNRWVDVAITEY